MSDYKWKPFTLLVSAEEVEREVKFKLEAGKYYKTRDGRKVGPMYQSGTYYRYGLHNPSYYEDGIVWHSRPTPHDIISEWNESPIREVTRRELVAGEYGCAVVKDGGILYIPEGNYSSEMLRETAHALNQIAEYLESEGK